MNPKVIVTVKNDSKHTQTANKTVQPIYGKTLVWDRVNYEKPELEASTIV